MKPTFRGASVKQLGCACMLLFLLMVSGLYRAQVQSESKVNLEGAIDFRVHSGPDSDARTADADDVAKIGQQMGMRALVLTNHYESTAALAYMVGKEVPGIEVFGSIALNLPVGGVNLEAVKRMTMMKGGRGRVVFLPDFDSENFRNVLHQTGTAVPIYRDGGLLPGVLELLDFIAQHHELVLETGDNAAEEVMAVVHEAHQRGVTHILIKNAMGMFTHLTVPQMQQAAREGAYLEFAYNAAYGEHPQRSIAEYADGMRQVGAKFCVLSTDFGSVHKTAVPLHPQALLEFMQALHKEGISVDDINLMAKTNPARLLGLAP
ncbi:MAG: DUF6282 family protein [Candidatus Acidiferrales bacterium]